MPCLVNESDRSASLRCWNWFPKIADCGMPDSNRTSTGYNGHWIRTSQSVGRCIRLGDRWSGGNIVRGMFVMSARVNALCDEQETSALIECVELRHKVGLRPSFVWGCPSIIAILILERRFVNLWYTRCRWRQRLVFSGVISLMASSEWVCELAINSR